MRTLLLGSLIVVVAACTSTVDEETASSSAALMPACGANLAEVDGIWAKSNGAQTNTGDSCAGRTAVGALAYQCVEYAQRYMNGRFGIEPLWPVDYAAQMCTQKPAGVTTHWAGSGYVPKHGDLVVWNTNFWGHVAVVRSVGGGSLEIVEQNASIGGSAGVRNVGIDSAGISCYVSANANTGAAPSSSSSSSGGTCPYGDGLYCGTNGAGTDRSKLYRCSGGAATVETTCALGCEWRPDGENDRCRTDARCPYGAGTYCGGNGITGAPDVLFECGGGKIVASQRCARGCETRAIGQNDRCP
jgi:hypothetical protein